MNEYLNKFIFILISGLLTKIISDPRNINIQIKDIINKFQFKKIINNIINNKNNVKIISYSNRIILFGELNTFNDISKLDNFIKNYKNKKIKIINRIKVKNNKVCNNKIFSNFIDKIKLYLILLRFNFIKLSYIKFFINNNEIFIIGICDRKSTINLIKLISFSFKNKNIISGIIHKDFIIKIK